MEEVEDYLVEGDHQVHLGVVQIVEVLIPNSSGDPIQDPIQDPIIPNSNMGLKTLNPMYPLAVEVL